MLAGKFLGAVGAAAGGPKVSSATAGQDSEVNTYWGSNFQIGDGNTSQPSGIPGSAASEALNAMVPLVVVGVAGWIAVAIISRSK